MVRVDTLYSTDVLNLANYQAIVGKTVEFIYNTANKNIVDVNFPLGFHTEGGFADIGANINALTVEHGNMTSEMTLRSPTNLAFKTFFYSNSTAILGGAIGNQVGMKFNLEDVPNGVFGALYTATTIVAKGSA
jgi:hypothetical protein